MKAFSSSELLALIMLLLINVLDIFTSDTLRASNLVSVLDNPVFFSIELILVLFAFMFGGLRAQYSLTIVNSLVTLRLSSSIVLLVNAVAYSNNQIPAPLLLRDALIVGATNIVSFAVWYWLIDRSELGILRRIRHNGRAHFAFPQQQQEPGKDFLGWPADWSPGFIDYLFLAFNTSTAFSPTDTAALSPLSKCLMMAQSSISLIILAALVASAINSIKT